jgi:hypothetical protein
LFLSFFLWAYWLFEDSDEGDSDEMSDGSVETGYSRRGVGDSEDFDDDEDLDSDEDMEGEEGYFPSAGLSDAIVAAPAAAPGGLDASRVQVMNSLFFGSEYRDEDGIRRVARLDSPIARPRSAMLLRSVSSPQPLHTPVQPQQYHQVCLSEQLVHRPAVINTALLVCAPENRLAAKLDPHLRSLQLFLDVKRLSFGVGFGPCGRMAVCGSSVSESHVVMTRLQGESSTKAAVAVLQLHKQHFWNMDESQLGAQADSFVKQLAQLPETDEYERSCWGLVAGLWGRVEESQDPNPHKESVVRRRLLCDWVASSVHEQVQHSIAAAGGSVPSKLLLLLSARRVREAVQLCIADGRLRLAAIVAACAETHESKLSTKKNQSFFLFFDNVLYEGFVLRSSSGKRLTCKKTSCRCCSCSVEGLKSFLLVWALIG